MLIVLQLAAANILLAIISYETLNFPVEMTNQKTVEFIPFWKKSFQSLKNRKKDFLVQKSQT